MILSARLCVCFCVLTGFRIQIALCEFVSQFLYCSCCCFISPRWDMKFASVFACSGSLWQTSASCFCLLHLSSKWRVVFACDVAEHLSLTGNTRVLYDIAFQSTFDAYQPMANSSSSSTATPGYVYTSHAEEQPISVDYPFTMQQYPSTSEYPSTILDDYSLGTAGRQSRIRRIHKNLANFGVCSVMTRCFASAVCIT